MSAIIIIKEGETKTLQKTTEPNSYERTIIMFNVKVKIYDGIKWHASKKIAEVIYTIEDFEIVNKSDAEMSAEGYDEFDPYKEYIILKLAGGLTTTFRNSMVDVLIN